jgi:hypothetical protein
MNPQTFTNQVVMVLMVDQDMAPILDQVKAALGLSSARVIYAGAEPGHRVRNGRLFVSVPLRAPSGEVAAQAQLEFDIARQLSAQWRSMIGRERRVWPGRADRGSAAAAAGLRAARQTGEVGGDDGRCRRP